MLGVCTSGFADYLDDIGYTQLVLELGGSPPVDTWVNVTQIEAPLTNGGADYQPNTAVFPGVAFSFPNAPVGATTSSHATTVGGYFYGSGSMAAGVTHVTVFDVNDWINDSLGTNPPSASTGKVQNSSWIGTTGDNSIDTQILERYDYAIHRDGIIAVVGVNNGVSSVPNLMAAGYNSIAVGLSSGNSSSGTTSTSLTSIYGYARQKPDIVVPTTATSWATAIVSSASTLLVSSAGANPSAVRPEVIRATLMAGATKSGLGGTWTHTQTAPLDSHYGAGQLSIYNSYHIQQDGQFAGHSSPSSYVGNTGWDLGTASAISSQYYYFNISTASDFSAVLTWDANINANFNWSVITPTLADLNLYLYNASGLTIGTLVDQSVSTVDNVELLWEQNLTPGNYALKITSSGTQQYGLAWQTIPEPSTWVFLIFGALLIGIVVRRNHSAVSA